MSPEIDRTVFSGTPFPPEVLDMVWSSLLTGSPFSGALTPLPTGSGSVAFPRVAPSGATWTAEGAPLSAVDLHSDALVVGVCKLAALVTISNESLDDATVPLAGLVQQAITESLGPIMDDGLLHGSGVAPIPHGILAGVTAAAAGADLRAAIIAAYGELSTAGATPTSIVAFAAPSAVAEEWARVDSQGRPIHGDSANGNLTIGPGVPLVGVPKLADTEILVADISSLYLVQRESLMVELSREFAFDSDSTALRVKARVNVAAPTPLKSLRMAVITGG